MFDFHYDFYIIFHCLRFDWRSLASSCCALFFCDGLMAPERKISCTYCISRQTPNIRITVVDGNKHLFVFSFADFLEIKSYLKVKICSTFGWKPGYYYFVIWYIVIRKISALAA